MPKKKTKRSAETVNVDMDKLLPVIARAIDKYWGDFTVFERAVGALILGQYVGWKVLRIVHDGATYKKYEEIFARGTEGFKFKDYCFNDETGDGRGPLAYRSTGLMVTDVVTGAWDKVRKSLTPEERKGIESITGV